MNTADHNRQKKIAAINDFSGFGRCSLAVELPVISHLRVQCCPVPTAVFSNHTGFQSYYFDDYTDRMRSYIAQWKQLNLRFEGITSGFLGSAEQIDIVTEFIEEFRDSGTTVIIDPVMGDNGKLYGTYTQEMREKMKRLVTLADILCPNVTEACFLTDTPYQAAGWKRSQLLEMARQLAGLGAQRVVITGIEMKQSIGNAIYQKGGEAKIISRRRVGATRSGTGDIFAAIIAADAVNGVDFEASVRKASGFISKCIAATERRGIPATDGVCFEDVLHQL
ncbi:MAG: Pyridoxal/pyridoxine/pyridoxamine kinase [Oscillospiraceae bacterium]|nr:Pyridoxal/pyridoxine/pyridoxamine kinase [Oscillospiraceae bacterium]